MIRRRKDIRDSPHVFLYPDANVKLEKRGAAKGKAVEGEERLASLKRFLFLGNQIGSRGERKGKGGRSALTFGAWVEDKMVGKTGEGRGNEKSTRRNFMVGRHIKEFRSLLWDHPMSQGWTRLPEEGQFREKGGSFPRGGVVSWAVQRRFNCPHCFVPGGDRLTFKREGNRESLDRKFSGER